MPYHFCFEGQFFWGVQIVGGKLIRVFNNISFIGVVIWALSLDPNEN
jgi:hypothetical protein